MGQRRLITRQRQLITRQRTGSIRKVFSHHESHRSQLSTSYDHRYTTFMAEPPIYGFSPPVQEKLSCHNFGSRTKYDGAGSCHRYACSRSLSHTLQAVLTGQHVHRGSIQNARFHYPRRGLRFSGVRVTIIWRSAVIDHF